MAVAPQPELDSAAPIQLHARRAEPAGDAVDHEHGVRASRGAGALAVAPEPGDGEDATAPPISVLVISPDRRFRSVTTVLIARRGCTVATTEHPGRLAELAARAGADVIVVDLAQGSAAGAEAIEEARSLAPAVGIVLVDEEGTVVAGDDSLRQVHCKWGPFELLYAAIQAAGRERDATRTQPREGTVR